MFQGARKMSCLVLVVLSFALVGLTFGAPTGNKTEASDEEVLFTDQTFDIVFDKSSEETDEDNYGIALRAATAIKKRPGPDKSVAGSGPPHMFYPHPPKGRSLILTIKVPGCNDACRQMARGMSVGAKLKTKKQDFPGQDKKPSKPQ